MAIVKHIKSRNANYSAAINYLLFEHDEKTGKKIVDESGRSILRKEFYMNGLNCNPMSFDKEITPVLDIKNPAPALFIKIFCFLIFNTLY